MEVAEQDSPSRPLLHPVSRVEATIGRICRQIEEAPGKIHRIEALAASAGLSRSHFCRVFQKHAGLPPQQFLVRARMQAARALLRENACSIGEVAAEVGHHDIFYFSRHFKEHHGISPRAFRRGG